MRMNTNIPMRGQQVDVVNALARGHQAGRAKRQANLFDQHGAGIAAGNQDSINALAQFDPQAALGVQNTHQNMQARSQQMQALDANQKRAVQEHAMKMSAAERAASQDRIRQGLMQGIQLFEQGNLQALNMILAEAGEQPISALEEFPAVAIKYKGVLEAMAEVKDFNAGPEPTAQMRNLEWQAEEAGFTRGSPEYQAFMSSKGGGVTVNNNMGGPTETMGADPSSPDAMISAIDGILSDPALDSATGMLSWMQNIPGTGAKRFQGRANQLEGQAFLQAFESLKGAGQITEIEGAKATQAIGRLNTEQKPEDYRAALNELRDILVLGNSRPKGWSGQRVQDVPDVGYTEGGFVFKGGDPADQNNWEQTR